MTTWDGISAAQHAEIDHGGLPGVGGGALWLPAPLFVINTATPSLVTLGVATPAWAFDQSTVEGVQTAFLMPSATCQFVAVMAHGGSGDIALSCRVRPITDGASTSPAATTIGTLGTVFTAPATNTVEHLVISASTGGFTAGAPYSLQFYRPASDPGDTLAADVHFVGMLIEAA